MIEIYDEIGLVASGVLLEVTHEGTAKTSEHPREVGLDMRDMVQAELMTLRISMGVSDAPLAGEQRAGLAREAFDALDQARREGRLLSVVTRSRVYLDYALTSVAEPRRTGDGAGWALPLMLKEDLSVNATTVEVPPAILAASVRASGKSKDKTQDATKEADKKEQAAGSNSFLKGLANLIAK